MLEISYTKLLSTICLHYEKHHKERLEVRLCHRKRTVDDKRYNPIDNTITNLYSVHVSPRIKVADISKSEIYSLIFSDDYMMFPYTCNCIYPIAYDPSLIVVAFSLEKVYLKEVKKNRHKKEKTGLERNYTSSRLVIFKRLDDNKFSIVRNDFLTPIVPVKIEKKKGQ